VTILWGGGRERNFDLFLEERRKKQNGEVSPGSTRRGTNERKVKRGADRVGSCWGKRSLSTEGKHGTAKGGAPHLKANKKEKKKDENVAGWPVRAVVRQRRGKTERRGRSPTDQNLGEKEGGGKPRMLGLQNPQLRNEVSMAEWCYLMRGRGSTKTSWGKVIQRGEGGSLESRSYPLGKEGRGGLSHRLKR